MDTSSESGADNKRPKTKTKRKCTFKTEWLTEFNWLQKTRIPSEARCIACSCNFTFEYGGKPIIYRHLKSAKHIKNMKSFYEQQSVVNLWTSATNVNNIEIYLAEAVFAYHTAFHSHSYLSADCTGKIFKNIFPDSAIAQKFTCGRTKCSKIVTNVLAKHSINVVLQDLEENHPFSLSTDASNKGNIKTFPMVLRYFNKKSGICTKLLSFSSSSSEASLDVANLLKFKLQENGLDLLNVTSFCADNANVNFGSKRSVFVELKKDNSEIIGVGCLCHTLHNSFRNSLQYLKYDIETIILKIFNEFNSSTKRTTQLKELFEFCDLEWSEMLRHVPTRWLSLTPAIDRLYKNYDAVKCYFMSQDHCPKILKQFFDLDIAEAYLGFLINIGTIFVHTIKKLETDNELVILNLFKIMNKLYRTIIEKKKQEFYGSIAQTVCNNSVNNQEVLLFKKRADAFLDNIITYLKQHFNFHDNKFEKLSNLNLDSKPCFNSFVEIVDLFNIKDINKDSLFEEFIALKEFCKHNNENNVAKKWMEFLNSGVFSNLEKICNYIFSIPHSNAMTERIFSLMFNVWRKDRNRLTLENVESELIVKHNFNLTCEEFYNYMKTENGKDIISNVKKSEKYQAGI